MTRQFLKDITLQTLLQQHLHTLSRSDLVVHVIAKQETDLSGRESDWLELRRAKSLSARKIRLFVSSRDKVHFKISWKPTTIIDAQINPRQQTNFEIAHDSSTTTNDIAMEDNSKERFDTLCAQFDQTSLSDPERAIHISAQMFDQCKQWQLYEEVDISNCLNPESDRIHILRLAKLGITRISRAQEKLLRDVFIKTGVDSFFAFLAELNRGVEREESTFFRKGIDSDTWLLRQNGFDPINRWVRKTWEEVVAWMGFTVEALSVVYLRHLERYENEFIDHSLTCSLEQSRISPAQLLHICVKTGISNNMEEIAQLVASTCSRMDPCASSDTLYLENGASRVQHFDADTDTAKSEKSCGRELYSFTPYPTLDIESNPAVVQVVRTKEKIWAITATEPRAWNQLISPQPHVLAFVNKAIASCLFRATTTISETDGPYKRTFILQNCSKKSAYAIIHTLERIYGDYILSHHKNEPPSTEAGAQASFRFVLTNLYEYNAKHTERFDVARNLITNIPHIIVGGPDAHSKINFSGHEPVYVIDLDPDSERQEPELSELHLYRDEVHSVFMKQWRDLKQYIHLSKTLPDQMPCSVKYRSRQVTDLSTWALDYIATSVIQNERNIAIPEDSSEINQNVESGLSAADLNNGFLAYATHVNMEREQKDRYSNSIIKSFRNLASDHLSRMTKQERFWFNIHLRKSDENLPVYYYPFGSKENRGFEDLYVFHTTRSDSDSKKTTLPRDCTRSEFFVWMKKVTLVCFHF